MLIKQAHKNNHLKQTIGRVGGLYYLAAVAIFLFSALHGFSTGQELSEQLASEDNVIVYTADNNGSVTITRGKLSAIEGKTIHLLPGTHIKSSEQLTVNISSRECQENIAKEVAKAREEEMLAASAQKREELITEENTGVQTAPVGFSNSPIGTSAVGQQRINLVAFLSTNTVNFSAPVVYLLKSNESLITHNSQLITRLAYLPVSSWGECAESISIMRC